MNASHTWLSIVAVLLLVLLNGFFVAAEFAMVKVRSTRIRELVQGGNRRAKIAQAVVNHLDAYLSACQLGITLASLALGWIGEPVVAAIIHAPLQTVGLGDAVEPVAVTISFVVITFLHIVIGELAPKSFAIQRSEGTVLNVAPFLILFHKVMYPFIWVLNQAASGLLRLIGIAPADEAQQAHTEEELRILMNESHKSGLIDQTEMVLFDNIFEFSDRIAREIMVPRIEMNVLHIASSHQEVVDTIADYQHTRYPVVEGDKDHILGYIHVKDMYLKSTAGQVQLSDLVRDVIRVAETAEISTVLRLMQRHKSQLAIVVDEYGGTAGLITLEDIIEELVGEIQDEFDDEQAPVVKTEHGYSVDGRVLLEEVNDLLGTRIDDIDVDTVGGWLQSTLKKEPVVGDVARRDGFRFAVEHMNEQRIGRISIRADKEASTRT